MGRTEPKIQTKYDRRNKGREKGRLFGYVDSPGMCKGEGPVKKTGEVEQNPRLQSFKEGISQDLEHPTARGGNVRVVKHLGLAIKRSPVT